MSDQKTDVKLPVGSIDWNFHANKKGSQTSGAVPNSPIKSGKGPPIVTERATTTWKKKTLYCAMMPLFFILALCLGARQVPSPATLQHLSKIPFATNTPDPLGQLSVSLSRCAPEISANDTVKSVARLSKTVVRGELGLRVDINNRLAPAGEAVQSHPEDCTLVDTFWKALNNTRAASEDAVKQSRELLAAVDGAGAVIDVTLKRAQLECKKVAPENTWSTFLPYRFFVEGQWLDSFTFVPNEEISAKNTICITRIEELKNCQEMQKHLSTLSREREGRLSEFWNAAADWSDQPRRWITVAGPLDIACRAEDDVGGVEGLWAVISEHALGAWGREA